MSFIIDQVEKQRILDRWQVVKYQLLTHCFLNNLKASDADLDCLTLLATAGKAELNKFCTKANELKIFGSTQTVRNCLGRAEEAKLVVKEGKARKKVYLNPELNIHTEGNILLLYKFFSGIQNDTGKK